MEPTISRSARQNEAILDRRPPRRSQPLMYHEEVDRLEETTSVTMPKASAPNSSSSSSDSSRTKEDRKTIVKRVAQRVSRIEENGETAGNIKSQPAQPSSSDSRKSKINEPHATGSEQMHWAPVIDTEPPRSAVAREPIGRIEVRRTYKAADDAHASSHASRQATKFARDVWVPELDTHIEIETATEQPVSQRLASTNLPDRITQLPEYASSKARSPGPSVSTHPKSPSERQAWAAGSQHRYASGDRHAAQSVSAVQEERTSVLAAGQSDSVYFIEHVSPTTQERQPTEPRGYEVRAVREEVRYQSTPADSGRSAQQDSSLRCCNESRRGLDDAQETTNEAVGPCAFDRRWEVAEKKLLASTTKTSQERRDSNVVDQDQWSVKPPRSAQKSNNSQRPQDSEYIYKSVSFNQ